MKLACVHFIAEEREFITKIAFRHIRHFKTTDTFGLIQFNREQIKDMLDVTDAVYMTVDIYITVFCRQGSYRLIACHFDA